jgi:hypothetical protein
VGHIELNMSFALDTEEVFYTDEVFYKILLTPLTEADFNVAEVQEEAEDDNEVVSIVKILTQSHLNSSTFIHVSCANIILPALDHQDPKASQLLSVKDVHGKNVDDKSHTISR